MFSNNAKYKNHGLLNYHCRQMLNIKIKLDGISKKLVYFITFLTARFHETPDLLKTTLRLSLDELRVISEHLSPASSRELHRHE